MVVVDASPPAAFHGVELSLGDASIGAALVPPFTFSVDTTAFDDGEVDLVAVGVVALTAEQLRVTAPVEIANTGPALEVVSPVDGASILGSAPSGFELAPVVEAQDPNGVASLTVTIAGEETSLGAADGTVSVALPDSDIDFPHAPVDLVFEATDRFGNASTKTIAVTPSILAMRFERAFGSGLPMLSHMTVADSGALVCQVGKNSSTGDGSLYVIAQPDQAEHPALVAETPAPGPAALTGDSLYYFGWTSSVTTFTRATLSGEVTSLFELGGSSYQQPSVHPFRLDDGRVLGAWVEPGIPATHLFVYQPDGALELEVVHAPLTITSSKALPLAGRVVFVAAPSFGGTGGVYAADTTTGALSGPWALPSGDAIQELVAADPLGVLALGMVPGNNGPPDTSLAFFEPLGGKPEWEHPLGGTYPSWAKVEANSVARVFAFGSSQDARSELALYSSSGKTTLWQGGAGAHESALGPIDEMTLALIGMNPDQSFGLIALSLDGAEQWREPLARAYLDRQQVLSDGSIVVTSLSDWSTAVDVALQRFDKNGELVWDDVLPCRGVGGFLEHDGVLLVQYVTADSSATVYEARDLASGDVRWRFREPSPANTGGIVSVMIYSPAWGLFLGPAPSAVDVGAGAMSNNAVVLGLVP